VSRPPTAAPRRRKVFLWVLGIAAAFVAGIGGWLYRHREQLQQRLIQTLNQHLTAQTSVKKVTTTLLADFPNFSVVFHDVMIAVPDRPTDTFLSARKIGFSIDLVSLLKQEYHFRNLFIHDARLVLRQDEQGKWQYRIWKEDTASEAAAPLKISLFELRNVTVGLFPASDAEGWHFHIRRGQISLNRIPAYLALKTALQGDIGRIMALHDVPYEMTFRLRWYEPGDSLQLHQASGRLGSLHWRLHGGIQALSSSTPTLRAFWEGNDPHPEALLNPWLTDSLRRLFSLNGILRMRGVMQGKLSAERPPAVHGDFQLAKTDGRLGSVDIQDFSVEGTFEKKARAPWDRLRLILSGAHGKLAGRPFKGSGTVLRWKPLEWKGRLSYTWALEKWLPLWQPQVNARGDVASQLTIHYRENRRPSPWNIEGGLRAEQIAVQESDSFQLTIHHLNIEGKGSRITIRPTRLLTAHTELSIQGTAAAPHQWNIELTGPRLHWEELQQILAWAGRLAPDDSAASKASPTAAATITANIDRLIWPPLTVERARGRIDITDSVITFRGLSGQTLNGAFFIEKGAFHLAPASLFLKGRLRNVDLHALFRTFKDFHQQTISYRNLKGRLSTRGTLFTPFDSAGNAVTSGIRAALDVRIDSGAIVRYQTITTMMGFLKLSRLRNMHFDQLRNRILIRDDTLFIPSMQVNSNEFRMWLRGYHTFAHQVEYYVKLNLNELIFGKKKYPHLRHGYVPRQGRRGIVLYLHMYGPADSMRVEYAPRQVKKMLNIQPDQPSVSPGYELEWD